LRFTNPDDENRVVFGETGWTDYVVRVTATLVTGNGYGIYYRTDGKAGFAPGITGYCFQFEPGLGKLLVRKVMDGYESEPFRSVAMPAAVVAAPGSPHELSVGVEGSHHVISIDGAVVLDFTMTPSAQAWPGCEAGTAAIHCSAP